MDRPLVAMREVGVELTAAITSEIGRDRPGRVTDVNGDDPENCLTFFALCVKVDSLLSLRGYKRVVRR